MDSTTIVIDSGVAAFDSFLPQIAIFVIIPLLAALQKWTWWDTTIPSTISAAALCQGAAFAVAHWLAPDATAIQTVQTGFAMTGSVLVAHRTMLWAMPKAKVAATAILNCFRIT